jgi:hypothetical protein
VIDQHANDQIKKSILKNGTHTIFGIRTSLLVCVCVPLKKYFNLTQLINFDFFRSKREKICPKNGYFMIVIFLLTTKMFFRIQFPDKFLSLYVTYIQLFSELLFVYLFMF